MRITEVGLKHALLSAMRSASSTDLDVPQKRLRTVGDRAFCVAATKTWNSLPSEVTSSAITVDI